MSEDTPKAIPATANNTDVAQFMADLDSGNFENMLGFAISKAAAASFAQEGKKATVSVEFVLETIPGTRQVRIGHTLKFVTPTTHGKASETVDKATVMHIGKGGKLSLAQPRLMEQGELPIPPRREA